MTCILAQSDTRLEWLGEGLLFKLDSNKCWRAKMQPPFESFPGPLLKSGMGPLARYGNLQEIINIGDLNRCILHLTQDRSGPGRGHYSSRTQLNARGAKTEPLFQSPPRLSLKSALQPFFKYGTHQTTSGRLEQVYLPSDPWLEWHGEGPLFKLNLNKCWGQNVETIRVTTGHYLW